MNLYDAMKPKPAKLRRNDPCPCGSGLKYKKCCLPDRGEMEAKIQQIKNKINQLPPEQRKKAVENLNKAVEEAKLRSAVEGLAKEEPEEEIKADLEDNTEDMTGRINGYVCANPECQHVTVTIHKDHGVTPFMIGCPKCNEMARSQFYSEVPERFGPPVYEWFIPENPRDYEKDHVERGGLVLRNIETQIRIEDEDNDKKIIIP